MEVNCSALYLNLESYWVGLFFVFISELRPVIHFPPAINDLLIQIDSEPNLFDYMMGSDYENTPERLFTKQNNPGYLR